MKSGGDCAKRWFRYSSPTDVPPSGAKKAIADRPRHGHRPAISGVLHTIFWQL